MQNTADTISVFKWDLHLNARASEFALRCREIFSILAFRRKIGGRNWKFQSTLRCSANKVIYVLFIRWKILANLSRQGLKAEGRYETNASLYITKWVTYFSWSKFTTLHSTIITQSIMCLSKDVSVMYFLGKYPLLLVILNVLRDWLIVRCRII